MQHFLFRFACQLLLFVSIIFVGQTVWQTKGWQYLGQVLPALTALPSTAVRAPDSINIFSDTTTELTRLWFALQNFWQTLIANLDYGREKIVTAWTQFLNRSPPTAVMNETTPVGLDPALLEKIKAEIKAELARELANQSGPISGPMSRLPTTGLVALPSSGNLETDASTLSRLENAFSDQVEVKFEASRQTGIITPVFKTGRGDNYLFVITPVNSQSAP